jgi:ribosomal protein S18 acetylase RimI-like enzyme
VNDATYYQIRDYRPEDWECLRDMSYEAAFWRPGVPRPPREEALSAPNISRYIEGWGHPGDAAVVAVERSSGNRIGAAWYRIMPEDAPGYGFVAPEVPELSMGVAAAFRGRGVGGALLEALLERAIAEGVGALSLSVEDGNPAVRLYERHGFERLFRVGNAWTMKVELTRSSA